MVEDKREEFIMVTGKNNHLYTIRLDDITFVEQVAYRRYIVYLKSRPDKPLRVVENPLLKVEEKR